MYGCGRRPWKPPGRREALLKGHSILENPACAGSDRLGHVRQRDCRAPRFGAEFKAKAKDAGRRITVRVDNGGPRLSAMALDRGVEKCRQTQDERGEGRSHRLASPISLNKAQERR